MRREWRERFPRHRGLATPTCMPGSLTSDLLWNWWRGKRSRHSWHMRTLQFYVSGKRPIPLPLMLWLLAKTSAAIILTRWNGVFLFSIRVNFNNNVSNARYGIGCKCIFNFPFQKFTHKGLSYMYVRHSKMGYRYALLNYAFQTAIQYSTVSLTAALGSGEFKIKVR